MNEIPSVSPCTFVLGDLTAADVTARLEQLPPLPPPAPVDAVADLVAGLARLQADEANIAALSRLVEEVGLPIRLQLASRRRSGG